MARRVSRIVRRDDERDRAALVACVFAAGYGAVMFALGYALGLLAP